MGTKTRTMKNIIKIIFTLYELPFSREAMGTFVNTDGGNLIAFMLYKQKHADHLKYIVYDNRNQLIGQAENPEKVKKLLAKKISTRKYKISEQFLYSYINEKQITVSTWLILFIPISKKSKSKFSQAEKNKTEVLKTLCFVVIILISCWMLNSVKNTIFPVIASPISWERLIIFFVVCFFLLILITATALKNTEQLKEENYMKIMGSLFTVIKTTWNFLIEKIKDAIPKKPPNQESP